MELYETLGPADRAHFAGTRLVRQTAADLNLLPIYNPDLDLLSLRSIP